MDTSPHTRKGHNPLWSLAIPIIILLALVLLSIMLSQSMSRQSGPSAQPTPNTAAITQDFTMYQNLLNSAYTQNGQYPADLKELEEEDDAGAVQSSSAEFTYTTTEDRDSYSLCAKFPDTKVRCAAPGSNQLTEQ